jgi:hypothetical protein
VLQFLVRRRRGHKQALLVAGRQSPDNARPGNCGVADGDDILQLGLKDTVARPSVRRTLAAGLRCPYL